MSTIIQYYIPEDNEDPEKMNAFLVYKELDSLRIGDIKENFPIPGEYYFRFKFKFQNKNVWIDFSNQEATLPKFEGKIIMKVSRMSWEGTDYSEKNKSAEKNEFADIF